MGKETSGGNWERVEGLARGKWRRLAEVVKG
jgi:hypothetical protein